MNWIITLLVVCLFSGCNSRDSHTAALLENPYINHNIPGETPQIFAPGLISSAHQEHSSITISPEGTEIWWSRWHLPHDLDKYPQVLKYTRFENGQWTKPRTAPFSGTFRDGGPAFSPDGTRIYFYSRRPTDKNSTVMKDNDLWYAERTRNGWGEPVILDSAVNSPFVEATPCLAASGNLYFASNRMPYDNPTGRLDIFVSEYQNGTFLTAVNLGDSINTDTAREAFPYVAPDERFLIFSRDSRRFNEEQELLSGDRRMMISFKNQDGEWGKAIDMGPVFLNTRFPYVTPDGRFFIFSKYTEGNNEDFYWINASFIEQFKREER